MSGAGAITALAPPARPAALAAAPPAPDAFAAALRAQRAADREAARGAAAQFVASTFIMPVLAELREGSFLAGPFARGFAERQFQPLLDQQIADSVTRGANFPLVESIVERLMGHEARAVEGANGR